MTAKKTKTKKKKTNRSKSKGNAFEWVCGRMLSKWLTLGKDQSQLVPSRGSGGWKRRTVTHTGDLAAEGSDGEYFRNLFVVECKHRNQDLLWQLFTQTPGENIQGWWQKLTAEAAACDEYPMLIVRQNNRPILVGLPRAYARFVARGEPFITYSGHGVALGLVRWVDWQHWSPDKLLHGDGLKCLQSAAV